jgi:uncharacterized protein YqeY
MSLVEDVSKEMKVALKARESVRLQALRNIRAAFLNEMKKDGADTLADEVCIGLLRRLEKQRKESIEAFEGAGRTEQADVEKGELAVIRGYLPSLADEETTRVWVQAAIEQAGVTDPKQLGKVMGMLMKEHKGEVDAGLAKKVAGELLGG